MKFQLAYVFGVVTAAGILSNSYAECINGLEGIDGKYFLNENVEVCCPSNCSECGGTGCHLSDENDQEVNYCCTSHIVWANVTCEGNEAPCLIEPLSSEFTRDNSGNIVYASSVETMTGSGAGMYSSLVLAGCTLVISMALLM